MAASWSSTTPKRPLRQEPTKNCCHKRSWQCGAGRYGLDKSKSSTKPDRLSKQPSMCHGCPHAWQFTIQNSTFRIPSRPSFPRNPLSPPCIPPKFVLHGLSSKSKFLAVITCYKSDPSTGKLIVTEVEPIRGAWPRNINIDPTSNWILAAGAHSNTIAVHMVDQETGKLSFQTRSIISLPGPICILFK